MIKRLRNYFGMLLLKRKHPTVIFKKGATCDQYTIFEGHNLLNTNARVRKCYIGRGTYISGGTILNMAKIGRFCSIGRNIKNSFGRHPGTGFVSTHPSFFSSKMQAGFSFVEDDNFDEHKYTDQEKKYLVEIGNDVWIGNNVMIMDGVKIGNGAIIGINALVTKDIEPYTIMGGVPAKFIKYRFDKEMIKLLLEIKWWDKEFDWIKKNVQFFQDEKLFYNEFK